TVVAVPASAHATLVRTEPSDGSRLEQSPGRVTLIFDEPVVVNPMAVRVYNSSGGRVDRGQVEHGASTTEVQAALSDLPDGAYVVTWQVVSADGHPINGAFLFEVGQSG